MILQVIGKNVKARTEVALYIKNKLDGICISDTDIPMAANHDQWSRWLRSLTTVIKKNKDIAVIVNATFPTQSSREQFRESFSEVKMPDLCILVTEDSKNVIPHDAEWEEPEVSYYDLAVKNIDSLEEIDSLLSKYIG